MSRTARIWLTGLVSLLLGNCADGEETVSFRLVSSGQRDPYQNASEIVIALEEGFVAGRNAGNVVDTRRHPIRTLGAAFGPLPFARGLVFRAETVTRIAGQEDLALAKGRSFPFDVIEGGPTPRPDVYLDTPGLFLNPLPSDGPSQGPDSAVFGMVATEEGALIATASGTLWRYVAHGNDGRAQLVAGPDFGAATGMAWAAVPEISGLLAVGGSGGGALLVDTSGVRAALPREALGDQRYGVALTPLPSGGVIAVGGAPTAEGEPLDAVRRIDIVTMSADAVVLEVETLPPLPIPQRDGRAIATIADDGVNSGTIVVVWGGQTRPGRTAETLLIDPRPERPPQVTPNGLTLSPGTSGVVVGNGRVLVAGGRRPDGSLTGEYQVLRVQTDAVDFETTTTALRNPVERASMVLVSPSVAMVLGGNTAAGATSQAALINGNTLGLVDTGGAAGIDLSDAQSVLMRDGSVLVAGREGVRVYVPH